MTELDHVSPGATTPTQHGQATRHSPRLSTSSLVAIYLSAIVAANLLVAWLGPWVSIVNAFLFVGMTITTRDALHDTWQGNQLTRKMALLVFAGSALSYMLGAGRIAIASATAFAVSESLDTLTYHLLRERTRYVRVNGSNIISAGADSLLFPAIAFGLPLLWAIVIGQFAAKVIGGALWALYLHPPAPRDDGRDGQVPSSTGGAGLPPTQE